MKTSLLTDANVSEITSSFFISINDTTGSDETPYFKENSNVKLLFFDDVSEDLETSTGVAKCFTKKQANELIDFITLHKDKSQCFVHCAAGISRSGAVGEFINLYLNENYHDFKKTNPHIHPNPVVLRILKNELMKRNSK